jgi:hypothetical protein
VAVVKNTLRILSVENIGETFNQSVSRLRYTPRRLLVHHDLRALLVAESDYQAVPLADNAELQKRLVVRGWHTRPAATAHHTRTTPAIAVCYTVDDCSKVACGVWGYAVLFAAHVFKHNTCCDVCWLHCCKLLNYTCHVCAAACCAAG